MSLPSSVNQPAAAPVTQKPGTNVYTVMLILAFVFIVTACSVLAFELSRYGPGVPWRPPTAAPGGS